MVTKTSAPDAELLTLAGKVDQAIPTAEQEEEQEHQAEQAAQAEAAAANFNATLEKMALGFFKAVRRKIAKTMPEILEEWPDELFDAPAANVPPVVQKYIGFLFKTMGSYPEIGALLFSMLPLVQGYFAAAGKQENRTVDAGST